MASFTKLTIDTGRRIDRSVKWTEAQQRATRSASTSSLMVPFQFCRFALKTALTKYGDATAYRVEWDEEEESLKEIVREEWNEIELKDYLGFTGAGETRDEVPTSPTYGKTTPGDRGVAIHWHDGNHWEVISMGEKGDAIPFYNSSGYTLLAEEAFRPDWGYDSSTGKTWAIYADKPTKVTAAQVLVNGRSDVANGKWGIAYTCAEFPRWVRCEMSGSYPVPEWGSFAGLMPDSQRFRANLPGFLVLQVNSSAGAVLVKECREAAFPIELKEDIDSVGSAVDAYPLRYSSGASADTGITLQVGDYTRLRRARGKDSTSSNPGARGLVVPMQQLFSEETFQIVELDEMAIMCKAQIIKSSGVLGSTITVDHVVPCGDGQSPVNDATDATLTVTNNMGFDSDNDAICFIVRCGSTWYLIQAACPTS